MLYRKSWRGGGDCSGHEGRAEEEWELNLQGGGRCRRTSEPAREWEVVKRLRAEEYPKQRRNSLIVACAPSTYSGEVTRKGRSGHKRLAAMWTIRGAHSCGRLYG